MKTIDKLNLKKYVTHITIIFIVSILLCIAFFYPSMSNFCTTAGNVLLVVITYIYVHITNKILREEQKKREIEVIQRQLEYFYYPMLHTIEKSQIQANIVYSDLIYEEYETGENHGFDFCLFQFIIDALKTNIEEICKYKYLSSEAIRKKFQDIEIYLIHTPFKYEGHEYTYYEYLNGDEGPTFSEMLDEIIALEEDLKSEIEKLNVTIQVIFIGAPLSAAIIPSKMFNPFFRIVEI